MICPWDICAPVKEQLGAPGFTAGTRIQPTTVFTAIATKNSITTIRLFHRFHKPHKSIAIIPDKMNRRACSPKCKC